MAALHRLLMLLRRISDPVQASLESSPARHADAESPSSGNGPLITASWHTLVRVWDGREVRQYVDGLRTNTSAVAATGAWTIHRWGCQFRSRQSPD